MKKAINLFLWCAIYICHNPTSTQAQTPTLYDERDPDYTVEKVKLPSKNHVNIIGRHPDGRLLVQCSPDPDPEPWRAGRCFFWVSRSEQDAFKIQSVQESELDTVYLQEITAFDKQTLYWTKKIKVIQELRQKKTGAHSSQDVPLDSLEGELLNPMVFHPRTSNYPILLFSAKPKGRGDYDIYFSELKGSIWTRPQPIAAKGINTKGNNETHPFVTEDGTLFFSTDRLNATGKKHKDHNSDLWVAVPTHKPYWENATVNPLPPPFNTRGDERVIVPLDAGFQSGFFVSDSADGPLKLYFFKSTSIDSQPPPPRYYALVVGVNDYDNWKHLDCPVKESRELARVLGQDYGFQVTTLESPDSAQFFEAIGQYHGLEENEYLLVAFMGHGIMFQPPDLTQPTYSVLVPKDAQECKNWATDNITCHDIGPCISPEAFSNALSLHPRHILILLDACRSGYFIPSQGQVQNANKSRQIISSTLRDEVPDCGHYFSGLMKALNTPAKNSADVWTGNRLFKAIKDFMTENKAPNTPQYKSFPGCDDGLDFPFPLRKN